MILLRQVDGPTEFGEIQNREDIYDKMMVQELDDLELAKSLNRQLNEYIEPHQNHVRDKEIARSLDRKLNETNDFLRDEAFARSLDRKYNISACTSEENSSNSSFLDHTSTPNLLLIQWLDRVKRRRNCPRYEEFA